MNPGFHRVEGRGRVGGRGESGYPSPYESRVSQSGREGKGGGKGRIRIPFPLPPSINFFSRNNQLNYSNNLITQIVTVAGKLQHDFFIILLEFDK